MRLFLSRSSTLLIALSLASVDMPQYLSAQTQVTAAVVNGVLNPTQFSGTDIGQQVNAAWASGLGKTVRIPPGSFSFSTTINHPGAGYLLECDAGTVLNYTGSGDAITMAYNGASAEGSGVDGLGGCLLNGTSSAQSGIHIYPSNHTFVRDMRIGDFTSGYGIYDTGGNNVELQNLSLTSNKTGVYTTGTISNGSGYAANAVHLSDSEINSNSQWGFQSEYGGCCTDNLGNTITNNVFEGNGAGDIYLDWDYGSSVQGNYFESAVSGPAVAIGTVQNTWGITIAHNYFTSSSDTGDRITIGYGTYFHIEANAELGATSTGCFIDVITGSNGGGFDFFGVGTNLVNSTHEWCNHGVGTTNP